MAQILKEEVRSRILGAATDQLLSSGESATMRQIAHAAGLTPGNLYRYYKGKDELVAAILQPIVSGMDSILKTATGRTLALGQNELPPIPKDLPPDSLVEVCFYPLMRQVLIQTAALCRSHPRQAAILMRMDSVGNKMIGWFRQVIDQALPKLLVIREEERQAVMLLVDAECQAFCSGVALLLQQCGSMPQESGEMLIENYLYIHMQGVSALLRREIDSGAIQIREEMLHDGAETEHE